MFKLGVTFMKRKICCLFLLMMLSGCYYGNGIPLLNQYSLFGQRNSVVVSKGETLYSISRRYNVEMKDLISANSLKYPYILKVGQVIKLPKTQYHMVKKGDTLYSISKKYNTDITSLSRINHLTSNSLYVGQQLLIPSGVSSSRSFFAPKSSYYSVKTTSSQKNTSTTNYSAKQKYTSAVTVSKNRKSKFSWPVKGVVISKFGSVGKGMHNDGINIKAAKGTSVNAADAGTVIYAGNELRGYGNIVLLQHSDNWVTAYAHNDRLFVKKGQKVIRGEKIASVGSTGGVSSPQLHFEIRAGKSALNPLNYLQ